MAGWSPLRVRSGPPSLASSWAGQEAATIGGTASAVLSRHAEQTALLVASAAAPQTFVRSLGPRSLADQAVVTGVVTALSYAATVATQDALTSVVSAWASASGRTEVRPALLARQRGRGPVGAWPVPRPPGTRGRARAAKPPSPERVAQRRHRPGGSSGHRRRLGRGRHRPATRPSRPAVAASARHPARRRRRSGHRVAAATWCRGRWTGLADAGSDGGPGVAGRRSGGHRCRGRARDRRGATGLDPRWRVGGAAAGLAAHLATVGPRGGSLRGRWHHVRRVGTGDAADREGHDQ